MLNFYANLILICHTLGLGNFFELRIEKASLQRSFEKSTEFVVISWSSTKHIKERLISLKEKVWKILLDFKSKPIHLSL
jgi:hypothetical protein